jgi:MFS family permease
VARPSEIAAVYAAAVVQGVALVTFPAASTIFTSPAHYGLTSEQYGGMFLPQALTAVTAALAGAGLGRGLGMKRIYLLGLTADLGSMALLVLSQFAAGSHAVVYGLLLAATAALGIGFGLTVPALNTFAAAFFPHKVDAAVLVLNALLGLGTALAPVFAALFVGLGFWWGLPILVAILVGLLLATSVPLPLTVNTGAGPARGAERRAPLPPRFWLFASFALLYGIVETMNGNWAALYMTRHLGASAAFASLALTVFWGTVTAGRVLFAGIETWLPARLVYCCLPLVSAGALFFTAWLPRGDSALGLLSFALAGLGCSALLPLTISFGHGEMTGIAASVAGGLIAFYQMGYGIAAFGVGPLLDSAGLGLGVVFGVTGAVAAALFALSFLVVSHPVVPATALRRPKMG